MERRQLQSLQQIVKQRQPALVSQRGVTQSTKEDEFKHFETFGRIPKKDTPMLLLQSTEESERLPGTEGHYGNRDSQ